MKGLVTSLALFLTIVAVSGIVVAAVDKDPNTKEGKIVSVGSGKLVLQEEAGKESTLAVADSAVVSINGKVAKLEDLKKGTQVRVKTNTSGDVIAITTMDGPNK